MHELFARGATITDVADPGQPRRSVLMIMPYVPSRIRVRSYHLLLGLAQRGHAITLVCPVYSPGEDLDLDALRPLCVEVVAVPQSRQDTLAHYALAIPTRLPLQAAHCLGAPMVSAVRAALRRREYDLVHVEHLRGAEIVRVALAGVGLPLVFDSVDCISLLFERVLRRGGSVAVRAVALLDLARTRRYEADCLASFQQILTTSPEDRWALQTLASQFGYEDTAPIEVIPNGVDLAYFAPGDTPPEPATVIFSGKLSYHANEAAALYLLRQIMPIVWRQRSEVHVLIAGANPPPAVRALAANPRVTVTGYLPDLRKAMARATLAASPIRYGVGIQNKVLEALAMGLPVVASPQATVALNARRGRDLLVASTAEEFASAILGLLDDPVRRAMLGSSGRRYVEQHHSWEVALDGLERCYAAAVRGSVA